MYTLKDQSERELTDLFEVHIMELKKQLKSDTPVNDWIRLFNAREEDISIDGFSGTSVSLC